MPDVPALKAEFFKALAHPLRIRVLELLSVRERTVSELLVHLGAEQPYVSQQLAVLRRAGLVDTRRQGTAAIYSLADRRVADLLDVSRQILLDMATATRDGLREVS